MKKILIVTMLIAMSSTTANAYYDPVEQIRRDQDRADAALYAGYQQNYNTRMHSMMQQTHYPTRQTTSEYSTPRRGGAMGYSSNYCPAMFRLNP